MIFYACSSNQEQDKVVYGIFTESGLPSWALKPKMGNAAVKQRYRIDIDVLIKQVYRDYQNFRDATPKPVFWTDSDYCDHVYFYNHKTLNNPSYNSFASTMGVSYLSEYMQKEKIGNLSKFSKYKNKMISFLLTYELASFHSSMEIDHGVLKKLEKKYAMNAEKCLDWIGKKNHIPMVPVCYFTMNASILRQIKENLENEKTIYILKQFFQESPKTDSLCLPFDLIFEYKFIEHSTGNMSLERRVLNPYVLLSIPVF